jgi:hypothetical protein
MIVSYAQIMPRRIRSLHEEEIVFGVKLANEVVIPGETCQIKLAHFFLN